MIRCFSPFQIQRWAAKPVTLPPYFETVSERAIPDFGFPFVIRPFQDLTSEAGCECRLSACSCSTSMMTPPEVSTQIQRLRSSCPRTTFFSMQRKRTLRLPEMLGGSLARDHHMLSVRGSVGKNSSGFCMHFSLHTSLAPLLDLQSAARQIDNPTFASNNR